MKALTTLGHSLFGEDWQKTEEKKLCSTKLRSLPYLLDMAATVKGTITVWNDIFPNLAQPSHSRNAQPHSYYVRLVAIHLKLKEYIFR